MSVRSTWWVYSCRCVENPLRTFAACASTRDPQISAENSSPIGPCPAKMMVHRMGSLSNMNRTDPSSSIPALSPRQHLFSEIRALNNLLTTKLHGDHLLFSNEQALNRAVKKQVKSLRYHRDLKLISDFSGGIQDIKVKKCLWWLQSMVSMWRDDRTLDGRESVELVRLKADLEDVQGWRMAINRAWDDVG